MDEDIYSNLALIPFTLAGFTWYSAEQYFQAAKFTDAEIIQRIQECPIHFAVPRWDKPDALKSVTIGKPSKSR